MKCEDIIMSENGRVVGKEIVDASFDEWMAYVFDHPVTAEHWRWSDDYMEWSVPAYKTVEFLTRTFEESGTMLKSFTDDAVAQGLWFLSSGALSEIARTLWDETVPLLVRRRAIHSIKNLYSDCLAPRCAPILAHLQKDDGYELNGACYMWWDNFPLGGEQTRNEIESDCLDVMQFALGLESLPCQESALHGLGHSQGDYPEIVGMAIDRFLNANPKAQPELITYARAAREGNIL